MSHHLNQHPWDSCSLFSSQIQNSRLPFHLHTSPCVSLWFAFVLIWFSAFLCCPSYLVHLPLFYLVCFLFLFVSLFNRLLINTTSHLQSSYCHKMSKVIGFSSRSSNRRLNQNCLAAPPFLRNLFYLHFC